MDLIDITFMGPPVDDQELVPLLPPELRSLLEQVNGFVQFGGGLHIRGACRDPEWHSLRRAWMGRESFHPYYREVTETDIPFAQDFLGNQYLLRNGLVIKLHTETGQVEELGLGLMDFIEAAQADPDELLSLYILREFRESGGATMEPGELLNTDPPLESLQEGEGVVMAPVAADEQLAFLREHHRTIRVLPTASSDAA
jgi:hypothetical protein